MAEQLTKTPMVGLATASVTHGSDSAAETLDATPNGNVLDQGLQRGLKGRHMQLFAIGSVIG
jgi:amino acid transporter